MDPAIVAALIAVGGVIIGSILGGVVTFRLMERGRKEEEKRRLHKWLVGSERDLEHVRSLMARRQATAMELRKEEAMLRQDSQSTFRQQVLVRDGDDLLKASSLHLEMVQRWLKDGELIKVQRRLVQRQLEEDELIKGQRRRSPLDYPLLGPDYQKEEEE